MNSKATKIIGLVMAITIILGLVGNACAELVLRSPSPNGKSLLSITNQEQIDLDFGDEPYAWWKNLSGNKLSIQFTIRNNGTKTIKAFELYVYATDVWGERLYGETTVYYHTTEKDIKPGKQIRSEYITIPDRNRIHFFYCGIKRFIYADNTVVTVEDGKLDYLCFEYKK